MNTKSVEKKRSLVILLDADDDKEDASSSSATAATTAAASTASAAAAEMSSAVTSHQQGTKPKQVLQECSTSTSTSSSVSTSPSLAEGRSRRKGAKAMKCPICLKTLYRAVMSLSDINDHINRCSDAQINYEKSQHIKEQSQSMHFLKKLKLDCHGNVLVKKNTSTSASTSICGNSNGNGNIDTADLDIVSRRKSMESIQAGGELFSSFEYLLVKHLDP